MKKIILSLLILTLYSHNCLADPAVVYFDPGMTHVVSGVDRYPTRLDDWTFDLSISPFYQHASGARNKCGEKVAIGDRLGRWEMFGVIWSLDAGTGHPLAAPEDKPYDKTSYPTNYPKLYTLVDNASGTGFDFTTEGSFTGDNDRDGDYSVTTTYEKKGVRLEFDISLSAGFGLTAKTGFVEYSQKPSFQPLYGTLTNDGLTYVTDELLSAKTRRDVLEGELGLDLSRYETVAFEDTLAQLYWSNPFEFADADGNLVVTVSPYVGAGVWIPTGKKKDQNKAFSMPTGHDGFWGFTLEGALNFDFYETVLINVGGGATFFETRTLNNYRVPSNQHQKNIYPWKANIKKRYGTGLNFNVSLYAKDIVDTLSVYFDFIYAKKERDSVTMNECTSGRNELFYPKILEEESTWKSTMIQVGFEYAVTPDLALGLSGQTHISGQRVLKTHTVMGSATFTF